MEAKRERKTILLTLTRSCNLACSYCFEDNKDKHAMSFETAKAIIDKNINDQAFDEYEFDFFGGEPFLCFDLIKQVVAYVAQTYPQKLVVYLITTNGVLVKGEIQDWLKANQGIVYCALSVDGTPEMHNINRCNSWDLIDFDFFKKTYPDQPMKMTVSQETLPSLADGVIFLHEQGCTFDANLAYDIDWSNPQNEQIIQEQLMKLCNYYLDHPDVKECTFFAHPIYKVATMKVDAETRFCGAGIETLTYDVDGGEYPCQLFMPLSIGKEMAEKAKGIEFQNRISCQLYEEPCLSCKAFQICHNCYGGNYKTTGSIYKKDLNRCKLEKITFKANAYYRFQLYKQNRLNIEEQLLPYYLKAIHILLEEFE